LSSGGQTDHYCKPGDIIKTISIHYLSELMTCINMEVSITNWSASLASHGDHTMYL